MKALATTCPTPCSSALQVPLAKHLAMAPIASHPWGAESEGLICILLCLGLDILMFSTRCSAESSLRLPMITLTMVPSNSHVFADRFRHLLDFYPGKFPPFFKARRRSPLLYKAFFCISSLYQHKWPIVNAFSPIVSNKPCTFQIFLSKT